MKRNLLIGLVVMFILFQFYRIDKTAPEYDTSKDLIAMTNPDAEIVRILKTACYDCHSYETKYPFYAEIAPISWWVKSHINEGREEMNYSLWGKYEVDKLAHKIDDSAEKTEKKQMPLTPYWMLHWDAKLTEGERKTLADWFRSLKS